MSDFLAKTEESIAGFTFAPNSTGPIDPITPAQLLNGKTINIQQRQLPVKTTLANNNLWRYNASGQYTNILTNGGQAQVKLDRGSGTGKCNGIPYLRLHVVNSDPAVDAQIVPAPLLIQTVQCLTPDGTPIQNHDGSGLWYSLIETVDSDAWKNLSVVTDSSVTYESGVPIEHASTTILLIPLVGNLLAMDFFLPSVDGDMLWNFYFWPATTTLLSGPNLTVSFMSLDVPMEQLDPAQLAAQKKYRKSYDITYIIPYERIQRLQQTWTASNVYSIPLNGIKGDVAVGRHYLRNSLVGRDLFTENRIASFQYQNSSGNPISGAQFIDDIYNRQVQQMEWCLGTASAHHYKYIYVWASSKQGFLSMLLNGVKYGAYPFSTNEQLVVTMDTAGTNEEVTITATNAGTIAGGEMSIAWSTPDGSTQYCVPFGYGASTAQIKAAIENMTNFRGTVNVTGSAQTAYVIEFTGHYGNRPLYDQGYCMQVMSCSFNTGGSIQAAMAKVTTPGVRGITSGSNMIMDMVYYTTSYVKQLTDGSLLVGHSG